MKLNRKISCVVAGVAAVAIFGGAVAYSAVTGSTSGTGSGTNGQEDVAEETGNSFSEDGTTQIMTEEQDPGFTVSVVTMTVDEVYAEAGSTVSEGDALFSVTADSIADAIAYYEDAVDDAESALNTAQIEFESGVLEAEYDLQDAQVTADSASSEYDAGVSALEVAVEEAKEEYDDTVQQIWDDQEIIDNNTYYSEVGIDEKASAIDTATTSVTDTTAALEEAQNAYTTANSTVSSDIDALKAQIAADAETEDLQSALSQLESDYATAVSAYETLTNAKSAAESAQSALELANQAYESAVTEYNTKVDAMNAEITELTESLDDLQNAYEEAQRNAVTSEAELLNTYEEAVLAGKYADTEYQSTLLTLQEAVDSAQEKLDTLKEEQEAVLAMQDGVVRADRDGVLAAVSYEAEDVLYDNLAFAYYYDTSKIYISVEVDQENIAKLAVGDTVDVAISGNRQGTIEGTISTIASSKTSGGSMSNVTYAVVVEIDNSDGNLSSGSSATVTFLADDTAQSDTESEQAAAPEGTEAESEEATVTDATETATEEAAASEGTEVVEETEETGGME